MVLLFSLHRKWLSAAILGANIITRRLMPFLWGSRFFTCEYSSIHLEISFRYDSFTGSQPNIPGIDLTCRSLALVLTAECFAGAKDLVILVLAVRSISHEFANAASVY